MVLLKIYSEYCFEKLVWGYTKGELTHTYLVMRPDTPPEIVERMKSLNELWKEDHEGQALYLFPGDEQYPTEWLNDPEVK